MRPRSIRTTTLLAVALGAAGCTERPAPTPVTAEPAPSASAASAPRCDDRPAIQALAGILSEGDLNEARRRYAQFRPVCDEAGYPLVGNFYRKGPTPTQPSAFCAEVRRIEGRP